MARPKKEYCDYFSHDRDMRNHRKIKALRLKYGIQGYAIWVMFLEFLTGNDNNIFENSDIELELLSGDFGVSVTEISDMINYCIRLNLLVEKDGIIYSESLNERLEFVYNKRNRKKSFSSEQPRFNGSFCDSNAVTDVVSVTEMPQSKVKEIKVKETKLKEIKIDKNIIGFSSNKKPNEIKDSNNWESEKKYFKNEEVYFSKICFEYKFTKNEILTFADEFLKERELSEDYKDLKELKRHFSFWVKKHKKDKLEKEYNPHTATGTEKAEQYKKMMREHAEQQKSNESDSKLVNFEDN